MKAVNLPEPKEPSGDTFEAVIERFLPYIQNTPECRCTVSTNYNCPLHGPKYLRPGKSFTEFGTFTEKMWRAIGKKHESD